MACTVVKRLSSECGGVEGVGVGEEGMKYTYEYAGYMSIGTRRYVWCGAAEELVSQLLIRLR